MHRRVRIDLKISASDSTHPKTPEKFFGVNCSKHSDETSQLNLKNSDNSGSDVFFPPPKLVILDLLKIELFTGNKSRGDVGKRVRRIRWEYFQLPLTNQ